MSRYYIVYDGRARTGDTDSASMLEVLGKFTSLEKAKKNMRDLWGGHDCALVSYGETADGELGDEQVHL
jgi:hypothetical protein